MVGAPAVSQRRHKTSAFRDRFETSNTKLIARACEAMRLAKEFHVTVTRDEAARTRQQWRGMVTKIERLGESFEIEVMRTK